MTHVPLLTVESTYWLEPIPTLILHPDFPVPPGWRDQDWAERTETVYIVPVLIRRSDGREREATARINLSHLNIRDPDATLDERWRLTVSLQECSPDEVPIGSTILVAPHVRDSILGASNH